MNFQMTVSGAYTAVMAAEEAPLSAEAAWLTPDELQTWTALHLVLSTLPAALGGQLRCDAGLSFLEYYVLASLSEQPGHTQRMGQLAMLAGSEQSRLSHLIDRLEKRGLVRREPDPADGRFTRAILTAAGHAQVIKAAPGHVEYVRHLIFDVLDETEQHALRGALTKIMSKLIGSCELTQTWPPPAPANRHPSTSATGSPPPTPPTPKGSLKRQATDRRTRPRVRV
jgi:DNA-binding MarR family transcriptional regulator